MLIQDGSLKAHFEDGYIIDEEKQNDVATLIQEKNSDLALRAFKEGFFITRRTLRKKPGADVNISPGRDITISMLDKLITSTELSTEAIDIIETKIMRMGHFTGRRLEIARWFIQILRGIPPYPTAHAADIIARTGNNKVPKNHKEFIVVLMQWWTGIIGFNNNLHYNLSIGGSLLATHTCSSQFDIPDTYTSVDDLYRTLITLGGIAAEAGGFQTA